MGKKILLILLILALLAVGILIGRHLVQTQPMKPTETTTSVPQTSNTMIPATMAPTTQQSESDPGELTEDALLYGVIRQITDEINNANLNYDLERIGYAARLVNQWINECEDAPQGKEYKTAYAFLVEKKYTFIGCLQALKLILDEMGYSWSHVNENTDQHQWLEVDNVDGKTAFADPIVVGMVGFGDPYEDDCYYYDWDNGLVFYQ